MKKDAFVLQNILKPIEETENNLTLNSFHIFTHRATVVYIDMFIEDTVIIENVVILEIPEIKDVFVFRSSLIIMDTEYE